MDTTFYGNVPAADDDTVAVVDIEMKKQMPVGEKEIAEATAILTKYKSGKANLEARVKEDEEWWKLRHWDVIRRQRIRDGRTPGAEPTPTSAWLFNSILNKHADALDNFPEPVVLPRERTDEESARTLTSILPVVMEQAEFEQTYSEQWWEKLKHGTAVYGVFWNNEKENGLGDIDIRGIDLMNIFYEPGITDIQKSKNLFICELIDNKSLDAMYPQLKGKTGGELVTIEKYLYDDDVDTSDKTVVIDWYRKVRTADGRTILHYTKYCGNTVLYSSENDPNYAERGFYDHGMYPVVFDCLFPEKGTPVGFGYVAICKDPQLYIDKLSANIMENSLMTTKKRFFVSNSTAINEKEFLDWNNPIVHVEGELSDERVKEISTQPLSAVYQNVLQMKIEEMKDTSSNRDVNSGGASSGVTAASAIAALQEAGNKNSRDMISASYRSYSQIVALCIELIRQFYDEMRSFRITGQIPGQYDFVDVSNLYLKPQVTGTNPDGSQLFRKPVFDLKIKAQKKSPFSRMEENERAKELYSLGFFAPERAQEAMGAIEMMDFEGIDKVKEYISQGQTLMNVLQQMSAQMNQMAMAMGIQPVQNGQQNPQNSQNPQASAPKQSENVDAKDKTASGIMQAQTPMTSYGDRLAKRSSPDMSQAANPMRSK